MNAPEHCDLFISYAHKDGRAFAERLYKDLLAQGFTPWLDRVRIDGGASWSIEIEKAINAAKIVIAVLTPGSYLSDICRAEQLRALRYGKNVIPIFARAGAELPLHLETKHYRDFTDCASYGEQFTGLLHDIASGQRVVLKPRYLETYVSAPPLPRNYVPRQETLHELRNALLADDPGPSIALSALEGMGGIGKTVLAMALCHDEVVQQAFPDGILWISIGKTTANIAARMRLLLKQLGVDSIDGESELELVARYRATMREKVALIVVDDIWGPADLEPYLVDSPCSRLVFTTRDGSIAAVVGAKKYVAGLLGEDQSKLLLAAWSGMSREDLPLRAQDLIRQCGHLPLAISMVGAMLRGKPAAYWDHVLHLLQTASLEKIHAQFTHYSHSTLYGAIKVSVDSLSEAEREQYLKLAVLPEDMAFYPEVLQALWNANSGDVLERMERLVDRSLAHRDGTGIRLHDLQVDYVRSQWPAGESLDVVREAVRLSTHVIEKDPNQFASQVVGRLMPFHDLPAIRQLTNEITGQLRVPWLRLRHPTLHPPGTSLVRTLQGHSAAVTSVAMIPPGQRVISASRDSTLRIWDLTPGRTALVLVGHTSGVNAVAVSHDGQLAVSGSDDKTVRVWDLISGKTVRVLEGHTDSVRCLAFIPNTSFVISGSVDTTIKVWNLESGQIVCTLEGSVKETLTFWNVRSREEAAEMARKIDRALRKFETAGHFGAVNCVAVTPDGRHVLSGSDDSTVKLWDLETGRPVRTLGDPFSRELYDLDPPIVFIVLDFLRTLNPRVGETNHISGVVSIAVTPDGGRSISSSSDATIFWDLDNNGPSKKSAGYGDALGIAVTADGQRAVYAQRKGHLICSDLPGGKSFNLKDRSAASANTVVLTDDGHHAISGSQDGTLKIWNLIETRRSPAAEPPAYGPILCLAVSPDTNRVLAGCADTRIRIWDAGTGRLLSELKDGYAVRTVAVTPDGKRAVISSEVRIRVWDLETGLLLATWSGGKWPKWKEFEAVTLAVSPDGTRVLSVSEKGIAVWELTHRSPDVQRRLNHLLDRVGAFLGAKRPRSDVFGVDREWDLELSRIFSENRFRRLVYERLKGIGQPSPVFRLPGQFSAGCWIGERVILASDKTCEMWDLKSQRKLQTLRGHTGWVTSVAVTTDGVRAVSASADQTLRVWNLLTGEVLHELIGHSNVVTGVALAQDGDQAVSISRDKSLKLWDLRAGVVIATFTFDAAPECCSFVGPDRIAAGDDAGWLHLLSIENCPVLRTS